jgi:hypothetical protein
MLKWFRSDVPLYYWHPAAGASEFDDLPSFNQVVEHKFSYIIIGIAGVHDTIEHNGLLCKPICAKAIAQGEGLIKSASCLCISK